MAVFALIILAVLVFVLSGTKKLFTTNSPVLTYMDDSAALAPGSPVRLNGILVGKVDRVELSGETAPERIIRVTMEIERDMLGQIPVDSKVAMAAENVLGAKFLNIRKGRSGTMVQANGELQALDLADFDEVIQQGNTLLASLQTILKRVDAIVGQVELGKGSIGKLLLDEELYNRIIAIVADGQKVAAAMTSSRGTLGKLLYDDALYADLRQSLTRVDTMLLELQEGRGTAGKLLKDEKLYTEVRDSVTELKRVLTDLNAGKGTAGKFLKDEELHNQVRASLGKVDLMLDKVNAGQGTVGQLLVNPQLYDSLNGVTSEMQQLVKDIRANPAKFLRIKLALF
ncbi:MAG TPA: MlaD family protein [Bryobacteraceae bacterium]|nr:MlaD family protein [Bryobacteraceae bacterium]